jgi:hypothetical protein
VADLGRFLQPAALAQKEDAFRLFRGEQVHDGGGVGGADAEVDDRQPALVGRRLHRPVFAVDCAVKLICKHPHIVVKVRQQHVVAEPIERHTRVTRQPVLRDFEAVFHHTSGCTHGCR